MARIHDFGNLRSAFVVFLCAVFFFLCMGLTLAGSSIYTNTAAMSDMNFTERTALAYLVNQVHRGDRKDSIVLTSFEGVDALCIREELGDSVFVTLLYCYEGQLRELFMEEGTGLTPADGTPVLAISDFSIKADDGIITLSITSLEDRQTHQVMVAPRCGYREGESL